MDPLLDPTGAAQRSRAHRASTGAMPSCRFSSPPLYVPFTPTTGTLASTPPRESSPPCLTPMGHTPVVGPERKDADETRKSRRQSGKSTYKHVPHREKPPHLVVRRNARERRRVQAVNSAFVRLRRHVPHENKNKRLSKVKTLRFAIDYINYLQQLIHEHDAREKSIYAEMTPSSIHPDAHRYAAAGEMAWRSGATSVHHGNVRHVAAMAAAAAAVDIAELSSSKENRWMPMHMSGAYTVSTRDLSMAESYIQYQG